MKILIRALVAHAFLITGASAASLDWSNAASVAAAAVEFSPALKQTAAGIQAARERVKPAASLPNPMLMGGVQNQQIDLSIDRQMTMYMVGASQTVTRRSRRDALRTAAEIDVERLQHAYDAQRAEVERDVLVAYYAAAAAQNQINAIEEVERLTKTTTEAARIRYETGAVPQADLIRSMLETSNIRHALLALRGQRNQAVAHLLAKVNLPITTEVPPFALASEMRHEQEHESPATLPKSTPAIAALEADVRRADEDIRLARLAVKPDWSVEAAYGVRPYERDTISVVGRIELPIRKGTIIEPRIREATARRDAAELQIDVLRQELRESLAVADAMRVEAREQIALHVDHLVPEARAGFESALASYQAGRNSFDSVLASLQMYVSLNADYYDFLRQLRQADAEIDAIRKGARGGALTGGGMTPSAGMRSSR